MKARPHFRREEDDDRAIWEMNAGSGAPFIPPDSGAISAWLRLQASTNDGSDWTNWVDVLNSNPAASISATRRPAVGASIGLPTAVFSGAATDTVAWPLIAAVNGATKYGLWLRIKPTVTTGTQYVASCSIGTGGANANKMNLVLTNGGVLQVDLFFAGVVRTFTSSAGAITTAAQSIGFTYDNAAGALDTDKFRVFVGSSYIAGTYSGAGTPGALPTPTGNLILGNYQDSTASSIPFTGTMGPNIYHLNQGHLTAAQLLALDGFEAFT
jgi:hypothetical protein